MEEEVDLSESIWEGLIFVIPPSYLYSQAETRAEFAERSVAKLEKTIDDLEGKGILP